ncbi:glycine betaine ABC transporter substrate-binding protein [Methanocalculus taiwanensis]|uniref:Glycine betaine ABC transporter substrate-binding protein n=1 Tax=Methanocalculus taiwanensis TaxID=106207 RepID=A0ABD4TH25_9EURY|nr:glycine betaine ABC transporter substrate-binding protein [Methanocalculus taiwanensis]MCQ1538026.1 glycine betaine ABC transporter substrate-binding protein [Methanocalculus taiwanensis]
MISKQMFITLFAGFMLCTALLTAGCVGETTEPQKEISIGYVTWDCAIASTHVMQEVFREAGYKVNIVAVDAGPLYAGLANGDIDFTTTAWLPYTHKNYWEQYGDQLDYVQDNIPGNARIGLVVPTYVTINSIEEMNAVADQFDGKIIGIDPGAGIMQATEDAIVEYGLDYELIASSGAGMAAELRSAYNNEKWIVVTGWAPHWKFGRFDLKFLDDPKGVYGDAEDIVTVARSGLKTDDPKAYAILQRFQWTTADIAEVMTSIEEGVPDEEAARAWISANPDTVNYWING